MTRVEFRDGFREIPSHLAVMMHGIETFRLTYDEAVTAANHKAEADFLNRAVDGIRREHFRQGNSR